MRIRRGCACAAFPIFGALLLAVPAAAQGPSEKDIANRIARTYDVKVLKTEAAEVNGKRVLYVTVMNESGNSNVAFQVTTLAVDPETGDLVLQYRTTPTGQVDGGLGRREPSYDQSGENMRALSTRGRPR